MTRSGMDDDVLGQIVDQLYDIAFDPRKLDDFIEAWNAAGFDAQEVRQTIEQIDAFDRSFGTHLNRADKFLQLNVDSERSALEEALEPFDTSVAMVLDHRLRVAALNGAARAAFSLEPGSAVQELPMGAEQLDAVMRALEGYQSEGGRETRILKLVEPDNRQPVLFHIRKLSILGEGGQPLFIVITNQFVWRLELDETLVEVFELTQAETRVVRGLVEGQDAKEIASSRGTSEGTVRSQIKSILAKTNAQSQAGVIRLVMSLRDVAGGAVIARSTMRTSDSSNGSWLEKEARKPFKTMTLPDGRRLDYHDQGPPNGAPVLFSHMGFGQLRWTGPMLKLAFKHGLRVICPVRAGYGQSTPIDQGADVLEVTRDDTRALMDHLGIEKLPYVSQGNDLIFAADLAAEAPERVSEIIGICARPFLNGDIHYAARGGWHRFYLSTAKHSPHLLLFMARAAFNLARKIGTRAMFLHMNKGSTADLSLDLDPHASAIMEQAGNDLLIGKYTNSAQAFVREILVTEADWSERIRAAKEVPIWCVNGAQDPSMNASVIDLYRAAYPWMSFETIEDAGQMLIFQHYDMVIPRIAKAAHRALLPA